MHCDKCGQYQKWLHRLTGGPGVYVCCKCNGCPERCK